jgi:hypothetical protein
MMTGIGRSPLGGGLLFDALGRPYSPAHAALFDKYSSARIASLASRELDKPLSLSDVEIRSLAGSVLTQSAPRRSAGAAALLGEQSSAAVATIASKAMDDPSALTLIERQSLAGSALTQTRNRGRLLGQAFK